MLRQPSEQPASPPPPPQRGQPGGKKTAIAARSRGTSASMNPIKPDAFGFDQARHLLLRAGFGGTPDQVRTLVKWGPTRSVDHLLNVDGVPADPISAEDFDKDIMRPATNEERGELERARRRGDEEAVTRFRAARQEAQRKDRDQVKAMQRWWLKRMIETPRPLEEKMTLFWHGLFATSYRTIEDSYHMFQQNQLFRSHAVGNYGKLMYAIIRDPAMIAYLDNNDSRKGKPNENLARELMELFSLGVGNYSEQDIKEGARALTGYTFEDDEFEFKKNNHDTGMKRILGRSGPLDGDGFVSAILEHPACSKYIAERLYRYFAADYPTGNKTLDQTCAAAIGQLQSTLLSSRYEVKPVLRRLFLSEHFYQDAIMGEQIKSPAELVVGLVRQFHPPVRDLGVLSDAMGMMGQSLMFPPSVKGWNGGRTWINTATMFTRQNIACFLLTGRTPSGFDPLSKQETFEAEDLLSQILGSDWQGKDVGESVDEILRFCLGRSSTYNRETVLNFVTQRGGKFTPEVFTQSLLLITAMPEYQLC